MLEYLGPELPWELCRNNEVLACEPGYRLFSSARSSQHLYYLQERQVWCQNSVEYHVVAVCPHQPLALRWRNGVLYVLLADGLRYCLTPALCREGVYYTLTPMGSAFLGLEDFYD
jgi:hypothetical protein